MKLIHGLRVDHAETADIDGDDAEDSVVFFRNGQGALALLGVEDFYEIAIG